MKRIDCCLDCVAYRPKAHICSRGANVRSLNENGDFLFADCPLEDVKPVKQIEIDEIEIMLSNISDEISKIEELLEKARYISGKYTTLYDVKGESDETHT